MQTIAILGTGAMGSRIASNLLEAGFTVSAWNRSAARLQPLVAAGLHAAASPAAAARGADVVISMLSDDDASRAAWLDPDNGACGVLTPGQTALECASTTPAWSRELGAAVAARGADYIEAPVVGSRPQAEAGQLIHLVGGDAEILERLRPILEVSAATLVHVGGIGQAMSAKLAVNMLFASQVAALGEALGALRQAGIDTPAAIAMLDRLPTTSPALKGIGALVAANNYQPLFPIDLVLKDLAYFEKLASPVAPGTAIVGGLREVYAAAQSAGFGQDNIAAVTRLNFQS